jgi:hypothetical protein
MFLFGSINTSSARNTSYKIGDRTNIFLINTKYSTERINMREIITKFFSPLATHFPSLRFTHVARPDREGSVRFIGAADSPAAMMISTGLCDSACATSGLPTLAALRRMSSSSDASGYIASVKRALAVRNPAAAEIFDSAGETNQAHYSELGRELFGC